MSTKSKNPTVTLWEPTPGEYEIVILPRIKNKRIAKQLAQRVNILLSVEFQTNPINDETK